MKESKTIFVYLFQGLYQYIHKICVLSKQNFNICCVCIGPHAPGRFCGAAAAGPPAPRGLHGLPVVQGHRDVPPGCGGVRGSGYPVPFNSYNDPDAGNPILPFTPSRPAGIHFGQRLLGGIMTNAAEHFFFLPFFTVEMINNIVDHTYSHANEHIYSGSHQSYTRPDGSWQDTTADEIKRLIALLIYFGLVKVMGDVDKYWSVKNLYHGLWARAIMSRTRFKTLMAVLHVVDPATEDKSHKLRNVESFIKSTCVSLFQLRQNLAIDERMVSTRIPNTSICILFKNGLVLVDFLRQTQFSSTKMAITWHKC